jgi:hypothetical protein
MIRIAFLLAIATTASGQTVRNYEARRAPAPPTIDGVITANEWTAAAGPAAGWGELLQFSPPDADTAGNRFRMMWDDAALYLLYETNQTVWAPAPAETNPPFDFVNEQLYLYFDPNLDDEPNFRTNPDEAVDAYEIAFNQPQGLRVSTDANRSGVGFSTEARVDSLFGDQANWNGGVDSLTAPAMDGIVVAQSNGASGGRAEVRIPWDAFDASPTYRGPNHRGDYSADGVVDAADYTRWRDTLGTGVTAPGSGADGDEDGSVDPGDYSVWADAYGASGTVETGLHHPFTPAVGDVWFFNIGQVTNADPLNFMPVYNWTESFFFAARPHAEISFVGPAATSIPEPISLNILMACAITRLCLCRLTARVGR